MFPFKTRGCPTKRSLIFLHGFLGQKEDFDQTISYLKDTFYCISIDIDRSEPVNSFQKIILEITDLIHEMNLKDPILVGYSMGGRIAHVFQHLSKVSCQSILIGSHLGIQNGQEQIDRLQWEQSVQKDLDTLSIQSFIQKWYSQSIFLSFRAHPCFQTTFEKRKKMDIQEMKNLFISFQLTKQPALSPHPSSYFFCGQYDNKYIQYYRKEKIDCHIIDEAGHVVHLENPHGLAQKIKEVLYENALEIGR